MHDRPFLLSAPALAPLACLVLALLALGFFRPAWAAEPPVSTLAQVKEELFMNASGKGGKGEEGALASQHAYEGVGDMTVEKELPGGSFFLQHLPVLGRPSMDGPLAAYIDRVRGEFAGAWEAECRQRKAEGEACGFWSCRGTYAIFESRGSLTVVFSAFEYRGGSLGLSHLTAFSYTRTGGPLGLSGLFADASHALQFLSDFCARRLARKLGKSFRREGVKAEPANFKLLVPVADGLAVVFPASQVAHGAGGAPLGVQVVKIPLSALKAAAPRNGIW